MKMKYYAIRLIVHSNLPDIIATIQFPVFKKMTEKEFQINYASGWLDEYINIIHKYPNIKIERLEYLRTDVIEKEFNI